MVFPNIIYLCFLWYAFSVFCSLVPCHWMETKLDALNLILFGFVLMDKSGSDPNLIRSNIDRPSQWHIKKGGALAINDSR